MKRSKPVRKRNRLKSYNYNRDGLYYFTSNVKFNVCFFGEVRSGKMHLNRYGKIVLEQWHWLEEHYPYVILHAFVIMPNHIHGILEISRVSMAQKVSISSNPLSLIKIKPLSDLIGAFKMTASKLIHLLEKCDNQDLLDPLSFQWHRSFHDHIIRSDRAYWRITKYINNNPLNWWRDEFFRK